MNERNKGKRYSDDLLSDEGMARREQIVKATGRAAARRYNTRLLVVVPTLLSFLLALLGIALYALHESAPPRVVQHPDSPPMPAPWRPVENDSADTASVVSITRISTEEGLSSRLAIPAQPRAWRVLSDRELLGAVSDGNGPVGLAYVGGRPVLVMGNQIIPQ